MFIIFVFLCRKVLPLPISILDESHAELVDAHLPYGGSRESLNHVRACIRHLPNHCVTDEKGRPVSWMLSGELCELRMAYTLPEHRRAGHLLALSLALIHRMSSEGLPVYCHVNQQNQATINAVTSLGFDACPSMENISVLLMCKDRVWVSQTNDNKVCRMIETTLEKRCFLVKVENITITLLVLWILFPCSTRGMLRFRQLSPFLTVNCK